MRRTSFLVTLLAFVAGLGVGYLARTARAAMIKRTDLAAIEKLHSADVEATLTQDPIALTNLWSDDGVNLGVPGTPVVGKKAMGEVYQKFRADYPEFKVLKYAPNIRDVQIEDGWAIEAMDGESTFRMSSKDKPVTVQGESMRVLKRQSDGSWKFALAGLK